jgi:hypothetical protein
MIDDKIIEAVARAIVLSDEQNGGAPWEMLMSMGRNVTEAVYDRARAGIEAYKRHYVAVSPYLGRGCSGGTL